MRPSCAAAPSIALARADLKDEDEKDEGDTEEDDAHALYYTIGLLSRLGLVQLPPHHLELSEHSRATSHER